MNSYTEQYTLFDKTEDEIKYEAFVDKFKPKKTTDDCYTPPLVYEAVKNYCIETYGINEKNIVRPFYPGGDYENFPYKSTDVVVDNPPFSILSKICAFYQKHAIPFFLFAPYLTNFSTGQRLNMTHIITASAIVYENGAEVATCFLTNLEDEYRCRTDLKLRKAIIEATERGKLTPALPKYKYDSHILTASMMGYMSAHGQELKIKRKDCAFISTLDSQKAKGKSIFGGGFILSKPQRQRKQRQRKRRQRKRRQSRGNCHKENLKS